MKKQLCYLLTVTFYFAFSSCSTAPEEYFGLAVLNCNLMHGFGGQALYRQLESPGVTMVDGNPNHVQPIKRQDLINDNIQSLETNYEKVKDLEQTEDNKAMIQASLALYDYVLPVYRNEYKQLAKLFDDGAAKETMESSAQAISDKYYSRFEELYNNVAEAGKPYAQKHNIKVNWDVRTSPR